MRLAMTWRKWIAATVAASWLALFGAEGTLAHDTPLVRNEEPSAVAERATLTGTVHEVVVDDAVHGSSARYVEMELDDGSLVALDDAVASALATGMRVQVTGRVDGRSVHVETAQKLAAAGPSAKAELEIEGTLAVLHADDFARGRSEFVYEMHPASGAVRRLRLARLPAELEPGAKLRVVGRVEADGESLTPSRITVLAAPVTTSTTTGVVAKAATASSMLVIMANFANTALPSYTPAQAQQVMTSNTDSVANFFREVSYGQQLLNVSVTPAWVAMNLAQPATCSSSDWQAIGSAAESAARSLGSAYDPSAYNYVVYLFPNVPACGWVGLAYIGSPHKAWINGVGGFKTVAIAHEMGHNFGLLHAASVRCSGGSIGGSCSVSEYGDPFDAMGNQRAMHYNATQKAKLAWIPSGSVKTHSGGAATYTLSPLEVAGGATYAVKIPTGSANRTYWLEYRQPVGFDAPLSAYPNNGAQIRVASPFETLCSGCDSWSDDTQLLDMTLGTSAFTDAALVSGQTFSDATYGINVTVVSASASALTVQVSTGGTPPPPTIAATSTALTASPNPSIAGALVTLTATVTGNAPSGTVAFSIDGAAVASCNAVALGGSGNARSATCATNALITGSHTVGARYSGDAANASSSASLAQMVVAPLNGTNVALAANGGVASASSTWGPSFDASTVIDGKRSGAGWGDYAGWADGTSRAFPDWVQINFNGSKAIDHVVVYSVQDNYLDPIEPTDTMTATRYALSSFDVQAWNGTSWTTLASVANNNLIKRTVSFTPYTTSRIRIVINGTQDGAWSRVTEVEAWTSSATSYRDYALMSNGGVASASSTWGPSFAVSTIVDGKRSGAGWGNYAGWADATSRAFPDWVQVSFNGVKSIDHVVLYSVQDNYLSPVEPTDSMTGTRYVVSSFYVQAWNGTGWSTLASVTGNNLIKRTVWFNAYATDRIRISISGTQDGVWSRITEVEAWGN